MYVLKPFLNIAALLGALLLVTACPPKPEPYRPPEPEPEDPVLAVTVPGAYGVSRGNQVYNPDRHQLSVLECPDGTQLFRLIDVGERKVLSIGNLPVTLQKGKELKLDYRVMVNGYTLQSQTYENVEVLKVTSQMIWLKKDEGTYFVLKR